MPPSHPPQSGAQVGLGKGGQGGHGDAHSPTVLAAPAVPPTMPPSCQALLDAQALPELPQRNWALSQRGCPGGRAAGPPFSPRLCPPGSCGHRGVPQGNITAPRGRIMGGSVALQGAWPWLVSVQLHGELMCGGVLVGLSWVLTAAHCFAGNQNELAWTVVVGDHELGKPSAGEQAVPVRRILPHPKFNPKTFHGDLALLELAVPLVPSPTISPVCLPSSPAEPSPGTACYIVGWGSLYEEGPAANVVMEAQVPLLSQETCRGALGRDLITNTMFCAGYLSGGIDSCQGDSGGPLACRDPSSHRFVLYGITSWGDGCGERGKPGVYTRVTAFMDWLRLQMDPAPGSQEPSCFDLLAVSQLSPEQQPAERARLCAFYAGSCRAPQGHAACARLAEQTCRARTRRCGEPGGCAGLCILVPCQWDSPCPYPAPQGPSAPVSPTFPEHGCSSSEVVWCPCNSSSCPPSMSLLPTPAVAACPGLNESAVRVGAVRDLYAWVLRVPEPDLAMTFQEVSILVDLGSKNAKGLYRAQVRATVGGRPTAFTGLVGLESDSLARSMPGLVALALEANREGTAPPSAPQCSCWGAQAQGDGLTSVEPARPSVPAHLPFCGCRGCRKRGVGAGIQCG
uniref:Serine protease 56 n=1 Tax=Strigops habroptila TaxID=2489341 RepID=A0A672V2R3_STRHB